MSAARFSMRRFLLVSLVGAISGLGLLVTAAVYRQAFHEVEELFDAQLAQNGRLLSLILSTQTGSMDPFVLPHTGAGHKYERYVSVQRFSARGDLLMSTIAMPSEPLAPFEAGLSRRRHGDRIWHVFAQQLPDRGWLLVGEEEHVREELAREIALVMVAPYLLAVPLVLLLVWLALGRGMRPLATLAQIVSRRDDQRLDPIETGIAVEELAPLVTALNELFARVRDAMAREQRFTADAAHELRTLLAVLKLHAENARFLTDPQERQASLDSLQQGVDRATHMVAQLLALARLDPAADSPAGVQVTPVAPVCRQVLADLAPEAERRGQQLGASMDEHCQVALPAAALDILMRNLVNNALAYGPEGGGVDIEVTAAGPMVRLAVSDDGDGISPESAGRVCERFYRGHTDVAGAGLGLSIVSRLVELAGGTLRFSARSAGQRASVVVELPAVGAA